MAVMILPDLTRHGFPPEAFGYQPNIQPRERVLHDRSREVGGDDIALGAHLLTNVVEPAARTVATISEQRGRAKTAREHNAQLDDRHRAASQALADMRDPLAGQRGSQSPAPGGSANDLLPNDYNESMPPQGRPFDMAALAAERYTPSQPQGYQLQPSATRQFAPTLTASTAQQLGMAHPHASAIQADLARGQRTTAPADMRLHGRTALSPVAQDALARQRPPVNESGLADNAQTAAGHEAVRLYNLDHNGTVSERSSAATGGAAAGNAQPAASSGPIAVTDHGGVTIDPDRAYSSRELQVLAEQAHAIQDPAARTAATNAVRKAAAHPLAFHDVTGNTWADAFGTEGSVVGQHRKHVLGIMHEKPVDPLLQDRHDRLRQQIASGEAKTAADAARLRIAESKSLTQKEKDESMTKLHEAQAELLIGKIDTQTYVNRIKQIDSETETRHRESEIARNWGIAGQAKANAATTNLIRPDVKAEAESKPAAARNARARGKAGGKPPTPGQQAAADEADAKGDTLGAKLAKIKESIFGTPEGKAAASAKLEDKKTLKAAPSGAGGKSSGTSTLDKEIRAASVKLAGAERILKEIGVKRPNPSVVDPSVVGRWEKASRDKAEATAAKSAAQSAKDAKASGL